MNNDRYLIDKAHIIENKERSYEDFKAENSKTYSSQIEDKFVLPDDELSEKILKQVELLFSNSNIIKDKFLLKHIRRNKEGYVSLKLISSFRKVKALTKDWRVVAHSLQSSEKLKMNNDKTKIRRTEPLPEDDDEANSKKVIVFQLPSDTQSMEDIKVHLKKFGTVTDVLNISNPEEASLAVNHFPSSECPFVILPFDGEDSFENSSIISPSSSPNNEKHKPECRRRPTEFECSRLLEEQSKILSPSSQQFSNKKKSPRCKTSPTAHRKFETSKPLLSSTYKMNDFANTWKQRRRLTANQERKNVIIIRQPKGPDGTIGFHKGRAKANLKSHEIVQ
ncbi:la-related protein 6 [Caerostris darwini]|uniref:La-related protein 6 n=1 Tax=Caerostris darwini TaxID=1538125 RepID=A0AAV4PVL7_9ARAC|nr:la-related protein 6 [Caerostris darwini]